MHSQYFEGDYKNPWTFSIIGGILMLLSYSPLTDNMEWAFGALSIYMWCCVCLFGHMKFRHIWIYNIIKWLAVMWIWHPLNQLMHIPFLLSLLIAFSLVMLMSTSFAIITFSLLKITRRLGTEIRTLFVLPLIWLVCELAAAHIFHFPWLGVLTTQVNAPYSQIFYFFNPIYSILFIILTIASFQYLIHSKRYTPFLLCSLTMLTLCIYANTLTQPERLTLDVSVVQLNIDKIKQYHQMVRSESPRQESIKQDEETLEQYINESSHLPAGDIIVWPETIIGNNFADVKSEHIRKIAQLKKLHHNIFFGATIFQNKPYNLSIHIGKTINHNEKKHHVPLSEENYPKVVSGAAKALGINVSPYSFDKHNKLQHFKISKDQHSINVASLICYDSAYEIYKPQNLSTDLFIIQSENIWFHSSWAEKQQLLTARTIAMINKKPLIYSVNGSRSGFIHHDGMVNMSLDGKTTHHSDKIAASYH